MTEKKTTIIAEAGVNHNGDLGRAKELVDAAAQAGADIVKFQTFRVDRISTTYTPKAEYSKESTRQEQSDYDMLKSLELTLDEQMELQENGVLSR
jgi:N,N'-diacetyllegionaminate synthase